MSKNASMRSVRAAQLRRPGVGARRAGAGTTFGVAALLTLGACGSAPAASELPVAVPTTIGTPSPTSSTSVALPTASGRLHEPDAVVQAIEKNRPKQLTEVDPPRAKDHPLTLCPSAAALTPPKSLPTFHAEYASAVNNSVLTVDAVTYPTVAAASAQAQPLLDAVANCTAGPAPTDRPKATVTVSEQKSSDVQGFPFGRLLVATADGGSTEYTWVGLVAVDNAIVRISSTAPTKAAATSMGSRSMAQWIITVSTS